MSYKNFNDIFGDAKNGKDIFEFVQGKGFKKIGKTHYEKKLPWGDMSIKLSWSEKTHDLHLKVFRKREEMVKIKLWNFPTDNIDKLENEFAHLVSDINDVLDMKAELFA